MERTIIWFGLMLVAAGLLLVGLGYLSDHAGREGRLLPGDIVVSRPGFRFVFPIVSSIVLSILLHGLTANPAARAFGRGERK